MFTKNKPDFGEFIIWMIIQIFLTCITFGLYWAFYTMWLMYKVDRITKRYDQDGE